jgi:hypothetical protein
MYSSSMTDVVFSGMNTKRDGTTRTWVEAKATGTYKRSQVDGSLMVEVIDRGEKKELNLTTFSGQVLNPRSGEYIEYNRGRKVEVVPPPPYSNRTQWMKDY